MGHGRERWEKGNKNGRTNGKYQPTCTTCDRFLLSIAWLPMSVTDNVHMYIILIGNLPAE